MKRNSTNVKEKPDDLLKYNFNIQTDGKNDDTHVIRSKCCCSLEIFLWIVLTVSETKKMCKTFLKFCNAVQLETFEWCLPTSRKLGNAKLD